MEAFDTGFIDIYVKFVLFISAIIVMAMFRKKFSVLRIMVICIVVLLLSITQLTYISGMKNGPSVDLAFNLIFVTMPVHLL